MSTKLLKKFYVINLEDNILDLIQLIDGLHLHKKVYDTYDKKVLIKEPVLLKDSNDTATPLFFYLADLIVKKKFKTFVKDVKDDDSLLLSLTLELEDFINNKTKVLNKTHKELYNSFDYIYTDLSNIYSYSEDMTILDIEERWFNNKELGVIEAYDLYLNKDQNLKLTNLGYDLNSEDYEDYSEDSSESSESSLDNELNDILSQIVLKEQKDSRVSDDLELDNLKIAKSDTEDNTDFFDKLERLDAENKMLNRKIDELLNMIVDLKSPNLEVKKQKSLNTDFKLFYTSLIVDKNLTKELAVNLASLNIGDGDDIKIYTIISMYMKLAADKNFANFNNNVL